MADLAALHPRLIPGLYRAVLLNIRIHSVLYLTGDLIFTRGRVIKQLSLIIFTVRKYATRHHHCYHCHCERLIILLIFQIFILLESATRFLNIAKRNEIDFFSRL